MLSIVVPLTASIRQRNSFLDEVRAQNFPFKALQVVFVSQKTELLRSLPQEPFSVLSIKAQGKSISEWKDQAARETSGEIVYFLSEDVIFDNSEDLLRIYEYFLENPGISTAVGYDVFHRVIGNENNSAPQIFSSEIMPQLGETNLCVRREVIEAGFLFSCLVLGETPIEELKNMGRTPEKLKWLQLHHKKNMSVYFVRLLKTWDWIVQSYKSTVQHPLLQKSVRIVHDVYYSERTQRVLSRTRSLTLQAVEWFIRQAQQVGPVMVAADTRFFRFLEKLYLDLKSSRALKKPEVRSDKKVFVPHLASDDRNHNKDAPRFVLKSRSDKDLTP